MEATTRVQQHQPHRRRHGVAQQAARAPDRQEHADAGAAGRDRSRRPQRRQGPDHRRKRRRQGDRVARHSLRQPARQHDVCAGQLRRPARNAARVGAVRPRQGQLHRRLSRQARQARVRAHGHGVPRRNRRDDAAHAGPVAALPRDRRNPAGRRRRRRAPRQRAHHRRDASQPARHDRAGHVPRRPLLPAERDPDHGAAAARAPRGHSRSWSPTSSTSSSPPTARRSPACRPTR